MVGMGGGNFEKRPEKKAEIDNTKPPSVPYVPNVFTYKTNAWGELGVILPASLFSEHTFPLGESKRERERGRERSERSERKNAQNPI